MIYLREFVKIRISAHNLNIEFGRYRNIERSQRLCKVCNANEIEDEFHFILRCNLYDDLRKLFIKSYYYKRPSVFKLIQLLSSENIIDINNLGKYLNRANSLRSKYNL